MLRNFLLTLFFKCLIQLPCYPQTVKDSVWIQTKDGCKVHNPNPLKNETITWSGECSRGYATGTGTLVWYKNGKQNQQYVGEMKKGIPHGQGRYVYEDGTIREGTYVNGDLDGTGTIIWKYKSNKISYVYQGELKLGRPSGYGQEIELTERGDTSMIYTGNFSEGEINGEGTMKLLEGSYVNIIKGKFRERLLYGHAEIHEYDNGNLLGYYIGEFRDQGRNGYGESVRGSNRYIGEWTQNRREGKGKIYLDTMLIYDGEWHNDKFNGIGKRFFFDGSNYFGEFENNLRHGFGTQRWKDGTIYIGEFKRDLYSGYGYIMKDGKISACGSWYNGSLISKEDFNATRDTLLARHKIKFSRLAINLK